MVERLDAEPLGDAGRELDGEVVVDGALEEDGDTYGVRNPTVFKSPRVGIDRLVGTVPLAS